MLQAHGVSYGVGGVPILRDVDLHIEAGTFVGVVGPNGAGKTTLMRVLAGILRPTEGRVVWEGRNVHRMTERQRARGMAFMSQNPGIGFGFTVEDVVAMGRYAHRRPWGGKWGPKASMDKEIVDGAMAATEVGHLRERPVTQLSGGERQRVFLARTLAQQPRLLFLDEPTSDLDVRFQLEIMDLVAGLRTRRRLTVVMAVHDLTWALRYCDAVLALEKGRVAAFGPAERVLTESLIRDVFGVVARIERSADGAPRVDFVGRAAAPKDFADREALWMDSADRTSLVDRRSSADSKSVQPALGSDGSEATPVSTAHSEGAAVAHSQDAAVAHSQDAAVTHSQDAAVAHSSGRTPP